MSDGTIEALKWLALILMTGDHINKYLLGGTVPALFAAGRLALPLFSFVLAFNLARPGTLASGAYTRTAKRLALFAAIATLPFIGLGGLGWGWWPLNILATLFLVTCAMHLIELGGAPRLALATLLFFIGGAFVEFWWPGLAMTLGAWGYARRPRFGALALWICATAALAFTGWLIARVPMSQGLWSLAALPVIFAGAHVRLHVPRLRWIFYAYYPAHLGVLWLVRHLQP
jgi:hypothetical protein